MDRNNQSFGGGFRGGRGGEFRGGRGGNRYEHRGGQQQGQNRNHQYYDDQEYRQDGPSRQDSPSREGGSSRQYDQMARRDGNRQEQYYGNRGGYGSGFRGQGGFNHNNPGGYPRPDEDEEQSYRDQNRARHPDQSRGGYVPRGRGNMNASYSGHYSHIDADRPRDGDNAHEQHSGQQGGYQGSYRPRGSHMQGASSGFQSRPDAREEGDRDTTALAQKFQETSLQGQNSQVSEQNSGHHGGYVHRGGNRGRGGYQMQGSSSSGGGYTPRGGYSHNNQRGNSSGGYQPRYSNNQGDRNPSTSSQNFQPANHQGHHFRPSEGRGGYVHRGGNQRNGQQNRPLQARRQEKRSFVKSSEYTRRQLETLDEHDAAREKKFREIKEMEDAGRAVTPYFEEELWRKNYIPQKEFPESVKILAHMKKIGEEEAKEELLGILCKCTLIESHLMLNGMQNAEKLFENMKRPNLMYQKEDDSDEEEEFVLPKAAPPPLVKLSDILVSDSDDDTPPASAAAPIPKARVDVDSKEDLPEKERKDYEQPLPFSSPKELFGFMEDLVPVFRYCPATNMWQNTGVQTRKFIQWLKKEMESGHTFKWDNFEEIDYPRFVKTIDVPEHQRKFAENELFFDFPSFDDIELHMPGFEYDFEFTEILSLSPVAESRLALNIPILTSFLSSNTGLVMDCSREWSGFVTLSKCAKTGVSHGIGLTGAMKGLTTNTYAKHFQQMWASTNPTFCSPVVSASGYLWPGSASQNAEIYQMEKVSLDYFESMPHPPGYDIDSTGRKEFATFLTAARNNQSDMMMTRERPRMKSKREIEQARKMEQEKRDARRAELVSKLAEREKREEEERKKREEQERSLGSGPSTSSNPFNEDQVDIA
uniref:MIF4G domain-containing protein n=1 Tax=Caenorhabditis tropicalis TaxID=1561998 RepID=A0A1I7TR45_9PELO